jgi:hypothetical protein
MLHKIVTLFMLYNIEFLGIYEVIFLLCNLKHLDLRIQNQDNFINTFVKTSEGRISPKIKIFSLTNTEIAPM